MIILSPTAVNLRKIQAALAREIIAKPPEMSDPFVIFVPMNLLKK